LVKAAEDVGDREVGIAADHLNTVARNQALLGSHQAIHPSLESGAVERIDIDEHGIRKGELWVPDTVRPEDSEGPTLELRSTGGRDVDARSRE
jgi:hypothetical protein